MNININWRSFRGLNRRIPNISTTYRFESNRSVEPFEPLTFGSARDNGQLDTSDDSDDSNDEDNWRNDYPDTEEEGGDGDDDENSVNEKDMRRAFDSMNMGEFRELDGVLDASRQATRCFFADDELSTDEETTAVAKHDGFVYSYDEAEESGAGGSAALQNGGIDGEVDSDDEECEEKLNANDVKLFGKAYARYKARILSGKRVKKTTDNDDDDDEDSDSDGKASDSEADPDNYYSD